MTFIDSGRDKTGQILADALKDQRIWTSTLRGRSISSRYNRYKMWNSSEADYSQNTINEKISIRVITSPVE